MTRLQSAIGVVCLFLSAFTGGGLIAAEPPEVTVVPQELRDALKLSPFYTRFLDADGLPVLSSDKVSDAALIEAVDIVNHMLDGRDDIRKAIIKNKVRLAVMAPDQQTTDIPEHSDLTPKDYWDRRARGLGATLERPAVSCGEENLLNLRGDRYNKENILVHEFAHVIHEMGLNSIDPAFDGKLRACYAHAMDKGTWKDTYAATNRKEYWAEGVQAYFDCAAPPEPGNHNDINTREKLEKSDPELFALIDGVFTRNKWRYVRYDKRHLGGAPAEEAPGARALGGAAADYERSAKLRELTQNKVFKASVKPHWSADGDRFWYRNDLNGGDQEFILVDAVKGEREAAFDSERLAAALSKAANKDYKAARLPIDDLRVDAKGEVFWLKVGSKSWKCDRAHYTLTEEEFPQEAAPLPPSRDDAPPRRRRPPSPDSPDGKWTAFVKDHNLYLREKDGGQEFQLSHDGKDGDCYNGEVFWSPDGKKLIGLWTKAGDERKVYLVQSSPTDQLQPKLQSYDYLKPGDKVPITKPHLFDASEKKEIPVSDELFANPYETTEWRWAPDSSRFTFLFNQRGHQVLRIVAIDAETGKPSAVVDEQSKTFIDYSGKKYDRSMDGTGEILWMSERDGWNHLYLYDAKTGQVKNQVTKGEWVVRGVDRVDEKKRQVWFRAGGVYPNQDPYYIHYGRINFDGTGLTWLTEGDGTHTVEYSPDGRFLIDAYSRVDMPPVLQLRRAEDGKLVCGLENADTTALAAIGWKPPEPFVAKGRDGKTDIYGVIYRPMHFDPTKKYPVIENIYAGPQDSFVPKRFASFYNDQSLAELGFIVVQIDGMGTSNRSKAFHDVCWKNLGDAGLPDRIAWIKAASAKYPYMDLTRVGIYGTSAGGQNSLRAMEAFPDFYKVCVSACGCHDNRMDKIWWNEQWMGWPIGPHYAEQSNATNAGKLRGKLLLIVGEMDHNVDPASTMQVVNALVKAGKDFDLLVVPNADHGMGGPYGARRMRDFFVRHLIGVEPPDRN
ncbi:MAG TPA: DPP IV N-terminal domain-containing protein [Gemmataceae bacterium]|nr:DPP IV N-terminal domain-containing protein [Gemmataceae bacterium]